MQPRALVAAILFVATIATVRVMAPPASGTAETSLVVSPSDLTFVKQPTCREADIGGVRTAEVSAGSYANEGAYDETVEAFLRVTAGEQDFQSTEDIPLRSGQSLPPIRLHARDGTGAALPGLQAIPQGRIACELQLRVLPTPLSPPPSGPPPMGPGAQLGVSYPYAMRTHCGVTSLPFDGRWWKVSPAFADPFNAPPGWNVNDQAGRITLLAPARAIFRPDAGSGMDEPGGSKLPAYLVPADPPAQDYDLCE